MNKRLVFWLGLKAILMICIILYANIGLGPDEAQYWTWSQALDWGYYSKPPGIAWQIALGTKLFGQTELGVRILSVVYAFLQALMIYWLALSSSLSQRASFWCALLMAFCPMGILGSLFAITDGGLLLSWTGAILIVVSALNNQKAPSPLAVGGCILIGALFKWPIYLFWIFFLCGRHWYFPKQSKCHVLCGILLSCLGLLPSIWWNASHDWATFHHVFSTVTGGSGKSYGNLGEFIGAQAILVSPIIFILLILAFYRWMRYRDQLSPALFFQGFISISILAIAAIMACFQKIQGNWAIFAYPTALILVTWDIFHNHPKRIMWLQSGLIFAVVSMSAIFIIPSTYNNMQISNYSLAWKSNPLKHNLGWSLFSQMMKEHGYQPDQHFLFSDRYQTSSLISFYGHHQQRAYFLNIKGIRDNQFSYWPSMMSEQQGKTGYFVWIENTPHLERLWEEQRLFYLKELQNYFSHVEASELIPIVYQGNTMVKGALIFRCEKLKSDLF